MPSARMMLAPSGIGVDEAGPTVAFDDHDSILDGLIPLEVDDRSSRDGKCRKGLLSGDTGQWRDEKGCEVKRSSQHRGIASRLVVELQRKAEAR